MEAKYDGQFLQEALTGGLVYTMCTVSFNNGICEFGNEIHFKLVGKCCQRLLCIEIIKVAIIFYPVIAALHGSHSLVRFGDKVRFGI